jgi:hypothetical protein
MAHLIELDLQLIDLAQDVSKTGDFGVGGGDSARGGAGGLSRGRDLRLGCELGSGWKS